MESAQRTETPTTARIKARAVAAALVEPVSLALVKRAKAEVLRERIDGHKARLLAGREYSSRYTGERITIPKNDWTMGDDDFASYLAALDNAVRSDGFNPPAGYCPALMAESELTDAENDLILASEPFLGVTNTGLLCARNGLETRRRFLDLLIGLVVNAPDGDGD